VKPAAATESAPKEPTQSTTEKEEESADSDKATFASTETNEASVSEPLGEGSAVQRGAAQGGAGAAGQTAGGAAGLSSLGERLEQRKHQEGRSQRVTADHSLALSLASTCVVLNMLSS
jgi:hypothetical protein